MLSHQNFPPNRFLAVPENTEQGVCDGLSGPVVIIEEMRPVIYVRYVCGSFPGKHLPVLSTTAAQCA